MIIARNEQLINKVESCSIYVTSAMLLMLLHGTAIIPSAVRICTSPGDSGSPIVPVIASPVTV